MGSSVWILKSESVIQESKKNKGEYSVVQIKIAYFESYYIFIFYINFIKKY